ARCLDALLEANHFVAGVAGHFEEAAPASANPLRAAAARHGLACFAPRDANAPEFAAEVERRTPDLIVLAGYARILRRPLWSIPPRGTINLHGGLLPHYRGASPINWQIINGEPVGGCAILYVDDGIDTGAVLCRRTYQIGGDMTAGDAQAVTLKLFPEMLVEVLARLERGDAPAEPQDLAAGCHYSKRYPWDGAIDWERHTDRQVHDLVRGLHGPGLPGAFTYLGGRKIGIHRTRLLEDEIRGASGRIALRRDGGVVVICANRGLLVTELNAGGDVHAAHDILKIRGDSFASDPMRTS
ncbi:MAG: methionyl-tRNA formyltransferase, partial [Planctomycetes bacterium]|nr:methionyl-tRNA formyltransferase [Planctomycetota bacterium]